MNQYRKSILSIVSKIYYFVVVDKKLANVEFSKCLESKLSFQYRF